MKVFNFRSSFEINRIMEKPIRNSVDLNKLLIKTIASIINGTTKNITNKRDEYDICICVGKMSRIFYYASNKIFSVCFPFYIKIEEMSDEIIIKDISCNVIIDLNIANLLNMLFGDSCIFDKGFEDIYFELDERLQMGYDDFNISRYMYPINDIWILITNLIKGEPGYLRYDYDEKNCNGNLHPFRHIDFYFSDQNTFKIGLDEYIDILDILDNSKERFYLNRKTNF